MARTLEEILEEMDVAQQSSGLPAPVSPSNTSFFGYLKKMVALFAQGFEVQLDTHVDDIDTLLAAQEVGTLSWYVETVKAFQYGDAITLVGNRPAYAVLDETKRIVAQASAAEEFVSGQWYRLLIKAVKSVSGELVPLASGELDALKLYLQKVKFAGVRIDVLSLAAAELRLLMTVEYDRQVLRSDGSLIGVSPATYPVRAAVENYIKFLPFNSEFYWTDLIDVLQGVTGVRDAIITTSFYREDSAQNWAQFTRKILAKPGHAKLHADSVITYV